MATVTVTRPAATEPPALSDRSPWRRRAAVALVLAGAMAVMIHRTPAQLADQLPSNLGDPVLVIWIMRWGAHALVSHPAGLFNANIFWPYGSTLAYADSLLSVMPLYAALYGITGGWTPALNVLLLLLMALNLGATYSLVRWLTGRTASGLVAALAFGFSALILAQMDHPQLQVVGLLPLGFLVLFKLLERPTPARGVALGAVTAAIGLGALYWAAIWAVSLAVVLGGWLVLRYGRPTRQLVTGLLIAGAIAVVAVAPTVPAYLHVQHTQPRRTLDAQLSFHARDLFRTSYNSWLWSSLGRGQGPAFGDEHRLFIGFTTTALAAVGLVGLVAARRRRQQGGRRRSPESRDHGPDRSQFLVLLALAGVASFALAAGGSIHHQPGPWRLFYQHVPGFGGIRVTARLAVVGLLALAALAGAGLDVIHARLRSAPLRAAVGVAVGAAILAELAAPLNWVKLPDDGATLAVYRELVHRAPGAVVELPMFGPSPGWSYTEPSRMVYSTIDFHPRLNGYSGYLPATYGDDVAVMAGFPSPPAFARLRLRRVRYLILHVGEQNGFPMFSEDQARRAVSQLPGGASAARYGKAYLVDLGPGSG